jgi:Sigma-54 interaction domain
VKTVGGHSRAGETLVNAAMKSSVDDAAFHRQSGRRRLDWVGPTLGDHGEVDRVGAGPEIESEPAPHPRGFMPPGEPAAEEGCGGIIGRSAAIRNALNQMRQVAPTDATVLICGETGAGKERFARAVHALSARSGRSFVKCHCAAIPTPLLESELFGHEKGAFTGAMARRIGRFEAANGGTLPSLVEQFTRDCAARIRREIKVIPASTMGGLKRSTLLFRMKKLGIERPVDENEELGPAATPPNVCP